MHDRSQLLGLATASFFVLLLTSLFLSTMGTIFLILKYLFEIVARPTDSIAHTERWLKIIVFSCNHYQCNDYGFLIRLMS